MRHNQTFSAPFTRFQRYRQRSSDRTQLAGKRKLPTDVTVIHFRDPVLLVQLQHCQRNRQIKARSLLTNRSRSDVDSNLPPWPSQRAVAERAQMTELFHGTR